MRLTIKLLLALIGLSALVIGSTVGVLYLAERRHLSESIEQEQRSALDRFAQVCRESLIRQDELSRLTYLRTFWASADPGLLSYAALLDDKGRVLMHSDFLKGDLSAMGAAPRAPALRAAAAASRYMRQAAGDEVIISEPIDVQGFRAGTAAFSYRQAGLAAAARRLQRDTLGRLGEAAAAGLALSVLFAGLLSAALTRPIAELTAGAAKIGEGQLEHRIPVRSSDELGLLAREFNCMAQKLHELDELKDAFLAQITHDLRNPLSATLGRIELLLEDARGSLSAEQTEWLQIARRSARYLEELIENILDLTKLEAGRMEFRRDDVALKELADSVAQMLKVKADEYGVTLDTSGIPPEARVWADPQALRRVLTNLCANALKFTPAGGKVSLHAAPAGDGGRLVQVRDTGIGIPEDKLATLFKKFAQIAETKNVVRPARGTGLGLVICKQLVEAHGGRIGVESRYKQGSTFYFTLPGKA